MKLYLILCLLIISSLAYAYEGHIDQGTAEAQWLAHCAGDDSRNYSNAFTDPSHIGNPNFDSNKRCINEDSKKKDFDQHCFQSRESRWTYLNSMPLHPCNKWGEMISK